jgi:transcriptional regulator with XRE-family HTH domain
MDPAKLANEKVKHARLDKALTQSQVAEFCRITLRQYQRLESGERSLASTSVHVGVALCDLLNLDIHDLIA